MLSYRHGFLFVHVFKVGGTSVHQALAPYAFQPERAWANRIARRLRLSVNWPVAGWHRFPDHVTAAEVRTFVGRARWLQLYKFAFVRNPWDWQVSLFEYSRQYPLHPLYVALRGVTFDEYLERHVSGGFQQQESFVTDESGSVIVDFIGRHTTLDQDFQAVMDRLGLHVALPHVNASERRDYRGYYTPETRRLIERVHGPDIERFGFAFDDGVRG